MTTLNSGFVNLPIVNVRADLVTMGFSSGGEPDTSDESLP